MAVLSHAAPVWRLPPMGGRLLGIDRALLAAEAQAAGVPGALAADWAAEADAAALRIDDTAQEGGDHG